MKLKMKMKEQGDSHPNTTATNVLFFFTTTTSSLLQHYPFSRMREFGAGQPHVVFI
jgi:hypothetical protein